MDHTLKGIQSSKDQKSLQSIYENHMEEKYDENLEGQKKNRDNWDWSDSSIKRNPNKYDKLAGYEQIPRPWLYSFTIIRLWGR